MMKGIFFQAQITCILWTDGGLYQIFSIGRSSKEGWLYSVRDLWNLTLCKDENPITQTIPKGTILYACELNMTFNLN